MVCVNRPGVKESSFIGVVGLNEKIEYCLAKALRGTTFKSTMIFNVKRFCRSNKIPMLALNIGHL